MLLQCHGQGDYGKGLIYLTERPSLDLLRLDWVFRLRLTERLKKHDLQQRQ